MKVLLHIGQSKTGTSAIQAFLTLNRLSLKEAGVLYPALKVNGITLDITSHNAVADSLVGKLRFPYLTADQYFSQFFDEAQQINAKQLILSAEHFLGGEPRLWSVQSHDEYFRLYKRKVEALIPYLKGHDVSIIVYLRPHLDWLSSAVSQTVRTDRLIADAPIYQNDRQFFELMKPLLMYSKLLNIWDETIKPNTFKVIPYNRQTLHKNSSIADFLYNAGIDDIKFPYVNIDLQLNKSLTREYLEVKKILNLAPKKKNTERVIIKCLEHLSESSDQSSKYTLSGGVQHELLSFVENEKYKLMERYKIEEQFFVNKGQEVDTKELSESEVNAAMMAFEKEFRRLRYRILWINYAVRSFLRNHIKPVHAALHQLKMFYIKRKYHNKNALIDSTK